MDKPTVISGLPDPVRQFSIFTENKVGRLRDITRLFSEHHIQVVALTTLDTTDSAIVRVVVDDPDKARILLGEHGIGVFDQWRRRNDKLRNRCRRLGHL